MIKKMFKVASVCLLVGGLCSCFEVNNAHAMLKSGCDYNGSELEEKDELVIDNFKVEMVGENCVKIIGYAGDSIPEDLRIPGTLSNGSKVGSIGDGAFAGCNTIDRLTFYGDAIIIGVEAFVDCNNIKNLNFNGDVTKIGNGAFKDCLNLGSICFANKIGEIGERAFANCSSLSSVYYDGVAEKVYPNSFENCNKIGEKRILYTLKDNPLCVAIHNDNVDEFQRIWANNNIDINKTVDLSSGWRVMDDYLGWWPCKETFARTPLISYCALCGSVKCFKFLMLNKAKLDFYAEDIPNHRAPNINLTLLMAFCSGNAEIIKLLEQEGRFEGLESFPFVLSCLTSKLYSNSPYSNSRNSLILLKWLMDSRPDLIAEATDDNCEPAILIFGYQKPLSCYSGDVYYPIVDKKIVEKRNDAVIQLIDIFKNKNPELQNSDKFHKFLCDCCGIENELIDIFKDKNPKFQYSDNFREFLYFYCGIKNADCFVGNRPFVERIISEYK